MMRTQQQQQQQSSDNEYSSLLPLNGVDGGVENQQQQKEYNYSNRSTFSEDEDDARRLSPPQCVSRSRRSSRTAMVLAFIVAVAAAFALVCALTVGKASLRLSPSLSILPLKPRRHSLPHHANTSQQQQQQQQQQQYATNSKYSHTQYFGYQLYAGGAPAFVGLDGKATNISAEDFAAAMQQHYRHHSYNKTTNPNTTTTTTTTPPPPPFQLMANPECLKAGGRSYGTVETDTDPVLQCYLGREDPLDDVALRLEVMRRAVEVAYEQADRTSTTLKVFVAPEFFWRGLAGAYTFTNLDRVHLEICTGPICAILKGLEQLVEDVRFEDWFFVFGTIVASQKLSAEDDYDYLYYNFAPIFKGYDPAKVDDGVSPMDAAKGKRFLLPKRIVSTSDFLTPSYLLGHEAWLSHSLELLGPQNQPNTTDNPFYVHRARYDDAAFYKFKERLWKDASYAMIEYDWLMVDGLSMALEICFDHQKGIALSTYLGDIVRGRQVRIPTSDDRWGTLEYVSIPPYQAQLQLVSSAGMTAVPTSMALAENGLLFLQDGLSNGTSYQYMNAELHINCDQGLQFEGGTEAIRRRAVVSNTDVNFLYEVLEPTRKVAVFDDYQEALDGVFSAAVYEPHIVVHDPVPLAEVNLFTAGNDGDEDIVFDPDAM